MAESRRNNAQIVHKTVDVLVEAKPPPTLVVIVSLVVVVVAVLW